MSLCTVMQVSALDGGRCVQASDIAATEDASNAASAASPRERGSTSPASTAAASASPAVESHEPSLDLKPAAKLPPARTSSAAEADALLADIAATVMASEVVESPEAQVGAPKQLQEPAVGPGAFDSLGTTPTAPAASIKGNKALPISVDGSGFTVAAAHAIWAAPASQQLSAGSASALQRSGE